MGESTEPTDGGQHVRGSASVNHASDVSSSANSDSLYHGRLFILDISCEVRHCIATQGRSA